MVTPATANDFELMFKLAPVSLWLEDYSALKELFDGLRSQGVTELTAHLRAHSDVAAQCASSLRVLQVNQRTLDLFGARDQDQLIASLPQIFRDDMLNHQIIELEQLWSGQLEFHNQTVNYGLDGRRLDVQIRGRVLPGHEARWDRVMVSLEDVTQHLQALQRLSASEQHARGLFEHSPVSLWVEDFSEIKRLLDEVRAAGIEDLRTFLNVHPEFVTRCMGEIRVLDVNQQTLRLFGAASRAELLAGLRKVFRDEMRNSFAEQLIDLWKGKMTQFREVLNYALSGEPVNIHMQFCVLESHLENWDRVLVSLVDITARKKAEAYLEYLGKHDVLTRLRNRAYYVEELNRLTRNGPWPISVLAIDVNGLKRVNDESGHAAGDALLRRVGELLGKAFDPQICAARTGGDEFTVLLPQTDEHSAQLMVERIESLMELNNQFYAGAHLSLSIGVASCASGEQMEAAINRADQAMYLAKTRYYQNLHLERRHGVNES